MCFRAADRDFVMEGDNVLLFEFRENGEGVFIDFQGVSFIDVVKIDSLDCSSFSDLVKVAQDEVSKGGGNRISVKIPV